MGGITSKKQKVESQQKQLQITIDHQKFQNYKIINQNQYIQTTVQIQSENQIKNWEMQLSKLINFQHKQNLFLPIKKQYQPKGFCGTAGHLKISYQFFPYLFSQQIQNRIKLSQYFQQQQLWYLIYSLVSCAKDFSRSQGKVGDIRPHNIFINQQGQLKIATKYSWPNEHTNFQKTAFQKQITYISPEQNELIKKGIHQNNTDQILSQSFSIGLTLLQAGLLFDAKTLYKPHLDIQQLQRRLKQWNDLVFVNKVSQESKRYSRILVSVIYYLCQVQPQDRYSSLNIEQILRPFQYQIISLAEFDKSSFPISNYQSVKQVAQIVPHYNYIQPNNLQFYKPVEVNKIQYIPQKVMNSQNNYKAHINESMSHQKVNSIRPHLVSQNSPIISHYYPIKNNNIDDAQYQQFKKYVDPNYINVQPQPHIKTQYFNPSNNNPQKFLAPTAQSIYTTTTPISYSNKYLDFAKKLDQQLKYSRKQFPS